MTRTPDTNNPVPCTKCGQPHARCTSHTRTGKPCTQHPMQHQRVCRMHGGNSPRALAAAKRRAQEEIAREAVATFGLPVTIGPAEALLEEVHRAAGVVRWLEQIVRQLQGETLVWGVQKIEEGPDGAKTVYGAGINTWIDLYDRERKNLVRVCSEALRSGVEERRVRLAESQGELVAGAIWAILADLGLSPEQEGRVGEVVPRHLRLLAGGTA